MKFEALLGEMRRSLQHGALEWRPGKPLKQTLKVAKVPDEAGAYVLTAIGSRRREVVYVGKAGTIRQDGKFKAQKLRSRLAARQAQKPRQQWYAEQLAMAGDASLGIEWFVTWDNRSHEAPALAEARMLQAYLEDVGHLPEWNEQF